MNFAAFYKMENAQTIIMVYVCIISYVFLRIMLSKLFTKQNINKKEQEFEAVVLLMKKELNNCTDYIELLNVKRKIDDVNTNYMDKIEENKRFNSMKNLYHIFYDKKYLLSPKVNKKLLVHR